MRAGLAFEKCFFDESDAESSVGGGFWMVISSTFIGGKRAKGACPCASSRMVMPNDQMSASELYLQGTSSLHGSRVVRAFVRARLPVQSCRMPLLSPTRCAHPARLIYMTMQLDPNMPSASWLWGQCMPAIHSGPTLRRPYLARPSRRLLRPQPAMAVTNQGQFQDFRCASAGPDDPHFAAVRWQRTLVALAAQLVHPAG